MNSKSNRLVQECLVSQGKAIATLAKYVNISVLGQHEVLESLQEMTQATCEACDALRSDETIPEIR